MFRKIMLVPVLAASFIIAAPVFAHSSNSDSAHTCTCHENMDKMVKALQLDEAQQAKIKTIKEQAKESRKANWQQMKAIQTQINNMAMSPKIDDAKLNDLVTQKTTLMGTMIKNKAMMKNQIFNVLNEKQQAQFQQLITNKKNNE